MMTAMEPLAATETPSAPANSRIVFEDVSRFYGDVLGVNRVNLSIPRGVTSLVGPNGSGKTTLMNLMTGLIQPTQGRIEVLGIPTDDPERLFRKVGYCTQFEGYPRGLNGYDFVYMLLRVHGYGHTESEERTERALARVSLTEAARRKVAAYSKGMKQRIKLAQAIAHDPQVLVLDEPLNGLDPMARAETIALFEELGRAGCHVIISSHILHEVDKISDQVILISNGYVVAEGDIHGVRSEVKEHPMQILIRCAEPWRLASRLFRESHVVEAKVHVDGRGLLVRTRDADRFYLTINQIVLEDGIELESVAPADDDVHSVYQYLIGGEGTAI